jgi:hypothetical protein
MSSFKIKVPPGSRYQIDAPDSPFQPHVLQLIIGKRGSGKSVYCFSYLRAMRDAGFCDRILLISPTALSNAALLESVGIQPEDVIDPDDKEAVDKVIAAIEEEAETYQLEMNLQDEYDRFKSKMDNPEISIYSIPSADFLRFTDHVGRLVPRPTLRYGHRPMIHVALDDCQSSRVFRSKKLHNLAIRHRHVGGIKYVPDDPERCGALGCSMYFMVQNIKAQHGSCPRAVRNNATQLVLIGKTADEQELNDIYSSVSGEVSRESFDKARQLAIGDDKHGCFVIDLHPKPGRSMFKKGLSREIYLSK